MLGAWFMATDMVGTPVTPLGVWVYGVLIGVTTIVIRLFGRCPKGDVRHPARNAATPLIESVTSRAPMAATGPRQPGKRGPP